MDKMFEAMVTLLSTGNPASVAVILLVVVCGLLYDRKRIIDELTKNREASDAKIDKIISDYYDGHATLSDALNELRIVLVEIKGRLER